MKTFKYCLFSGLIFVALANASKKCPSKCRCKSNSITCEHLDSINELQLLLPTLPKKFSSLTFKSSTFQDNNNILPTNLISQSKYKNLKNLKKIAFLRCKINGLVDHVIEGQNIKSLSFSNNNISEIRPEIFEKVPKLRELILAKNELSGDLVKINQKDFGDDLRILDLSNNKLEAININSFSGLNNLKQLILDHNQISKIEAKALSNLKALINLKLTNNRLEKIPDLSGLKSLKFLDLSKNDIDKIPLMAFNPCSNSLKTLSIGDNKINQISWPSISELKNLNFLNVTGNLIREPPTDFQNGNNLENFEALNNKMFCGCKMRKFKEWLGDEGNNGALGDYVICEEPENVQGRYLSDVSMDELVENCKVAEPDGEIDSGLKKIEINTSKQKEVQEVEKPRNSKNTTETQGNTEISTNDIKIEEAEQLLTPPINKIIELSGEQKRSDIEICLPDGLTACNCINYIFQINCANKNLEYVPTGFSKGIKLFDLRKNYIEDINKFAFKEMENLRSIHLQYNLIRMIKEDDFVDLHNLVYLYLNFNQIEYIHASAFRDLKNLAYLHLDHNQLTTIAEPLLPPLETLFHLDLSHNLLETLFEHSFEDLRRLRELILADNKLTNKGLPKELFSGLTKITKLDFTNNKLKKVPFKVISEIDKLRDLSLSGNFIDLIRSKDFSKNVYLKILNLANSNIIDMEEGVFDEMPELRFLNISNNMIINMPVPVKSKELSKADLSNNPFICNCDIFPFYMFMRVNTNIDLQGFKCAEPEQYKGQRVMQLRSREFEEMECV